MRSVSLRVATSVNNQGYRQSLGSDENLENHSVAP